MHKIGHYIKINKDLKHQNWYQEKPMKIIGYKYNSNNQRIYVIEKLLNFNYYEFHPNHVFQDKECILKTNVELRKFKLNRINK